MRTHSIDVPHVGGSGSRENSVLEHLESLADRFNARRLLVIALLTTAAAGLILLTDPSLRTLVILYAWWGVSTIALFWSPLIRTTREWGEPIRMSTEVVDRVDAMWDELGL